MSKVLTGSKAALKINGVKVVYISGVQITVENTLTPVDILDQIEVAEHAETGHVCSFTCNTFLVDGNSATDLGLTPSNLDDVLSQPELTMEMYNSQNDTVVVTISGVKWESGSGSVDARGLWTGSWSFRGRIATRF